MKHTILILLIIHTYIVSHSQINDELKLYLMNNEYDKAVLSGKKLCEADPLNPELFYKTAFALKSINNNSEAERFYRKAYRLDTTMTKYATAYAGILTNNDQYRKAIILYESILKKNENNGNSLRNLSGLYFKTKKWDKALNLFKKLSELNPKNSYYYRMSGSCYIQKDSIDQAIPYYKKAYDTDSSNVKNILQLATIYYNKKNYDKCLTLCNRGKYVDSLNTDFKRLSGKIFYNRDNFWKAINEFKKIIELGDSTVEPVKYLGLAYYMNREYKNALPYIKAVYKKDSLNIQLNQKLGTIYYQLENFDKSIHYYNKTLELLKPSPTVLSAIYWNLSVSYYEQERYTDALHIYNKRVKLIKENRDMQGQLPNDYFYLAGIYDKMKKYELALKNYSLYKKGVEKYLKRPNESKQYKYANQRISRIKEELHFQGKTVKKEY